MKRKPSLLLFLLCLLYGASIAQTWSYVTGSGTDIFYSTGIVGVGTSSPTCQLDVRNTSSSSSGTHLTLYGYAEHTVALSNAVIGIFGVSKASHSSGTTTYIIGVDGNTFTSGSGAVTNMRAFQGTPVSNSSGNVTNASAFFGNVVNSGSGTITNGYGLYIDAFSSSGITNKWGVYINDANAKNYFGGSVAIGTTSDYGYKLAVNGSAIFTEAKVKLYANWPDYVFHKEYNLRPLSELERFIMQNHHLPDMPSAKEVKEDGGIELGDMSSKLLKKVEELTLYIIELKKDNDELRKEVQKISGKK